MSILSLMILAALGSVAKAGDLQGPSFIKEPPNSVDFSNLTGVTIECLATGIPPPRITWLTETGEPVLPLPGIRQVLPGGELVFPAFKADNFRQDAHSATYRCAATNDAGTILSRDVHVRAVVPQPYDIQVFDVYAIVRTTAVLKCHVPSFLEEHVRVTMWLRDEVLMIEPNGILEGKYAILPSGDLHIRDVQLEDNGSSYRCHVKHRLTEETHFSSASGKLYVNDPQGTIAPKITDIMAAVHVKEGETVILPCVAQGSPDLQTEWFAKLNKRQLFPLHIGERVQQASGALIIHRAQTSDSGTYVCNVNNEGGSEQGETTVTVTAPLAVSVKPERQVVDIGKPSTFRCVITGFPINAVTWYKDGQQLLPEDGRTLSDELVSIDSVHVTDKGMYQCIVSNNIESAQGAGQLVPGDAVPEFVGIFEESVVSVGSNVSLQCVATGSPAPSITWSLDGMPLTRESSKRFTWSEKTEDDGSVVGVLNGTDVRWEEGGTYRCHAINRAGKAEHASRLNIYGRPAIRKMGLVTAVAGEDIRLHCPYYGYPIESITWHKDGRALPFNLRQVAFPNGTVLVRKVQRASDSGKYSCSVANSSGQTAQEYVELNIAVPPKIVPFTFQDEHRLDGMLVRVSCVVSRGDLPLTIRWEKDSKPISPALGVTVREFDEYSSVLSIDPLRPAHSGNYTCIASNHAATTTYTAPLVVYVPPRWKLEPRDASVLLDHSLLIDCQAEGFPTPRVTWMKARGTTVGEHVEPVESSPGIRVLSNGSIYIELAREYHKGHYFCQASNGIGDGLSTALFINVLVPPRFDTKFRNQTLRRGEGFRLECEPAGDTPLTFTWKKDGTVLDTTNQESRYKIETLPDTSKSDITVLEANRVDTGLYACIAQNKYGVDETNLQITVFEPPDGPMEIRSRDLGNRSVEITWVPPFDGHSRIGKYILEYRKDGDDPSSGVAELAVGGKETSAILRGLRPATRYQLRMFAENEIGLSEPTEFISFITQEEAPAGPPLQIEGSAFDATTLIVKWKAPDPDLWHGRLRGYYVGYKIADSSELYTYQLVEIEDMVTENHTAYITDLKKYTKYSITVAAFNNKGRGPASEEIMVMTAEDVPSQAPMDVRCRAVTSQSVHVTWQAPPLYTVNGILRGYKVLYSKVEEEETEQTWSEKTTSVIRTTLHDLDKFSNYSLRVLAFTKIGDGVASSAIYCRTLDDVPEVPADVKAVPASKESVLVAWKPPLHSNGVVNKYHVYAKHVDDADEDAFQHSVPPGTPYYEVSGLKPNQQYEFWVTAATMIGESQRSKMVSETPQGPIVPARIAAFDGIITILWKKYIKLQCKSVGNPPPDRIWTRGSHSVKESERIRLLPDGTLMVKNLQWSDSGNYTCHVKNGFGEDQVVYVVNVLAPPSAPIVTAIETTATSIVLEWKLDTDGGTNVQGYTLNYKKELGHWEQMDLAPDSDSYTLGSLQCGSQYQLYMTAVNKIGTSSPSEMITATTNGTVPETPSKEQLIDEDTDFVTLHLQTWNTDPCPITHFIIEYRQRTQASWIVLANDVKGEEENYVIRDLLPATPYHLRITAYNGAGSSAATFDFITLSRQGDTVSSHNTIHEDPRGILFYLDLRIIIPVAVLVLAILLVLSVLCLCANHRESAARKKKGMDNSAAQNGPNRPALRTDSTVDSFAYMQRQRASSDGDILRAEAQEKPVPYASFLLPNLRSSAEFTTFGQRNTETHAPPASNNDVHDENEINSQSLQHFSRPQQTPTVTSNFHSPNGKSLKVMHPVAIPTAPPATPSPEAAKTTMEIPVSPALRRLPEVPPKPNLVTVETRFSSAPDKVKCRVIPGPQR